MTSILNKSAVRLFSTSMTTQRELGIKECTICLAKGLYLTSSNSLNIVTYISNKLKEIVQRRCLSMSPRNCAFLGAPLFRVVSISLLVYQIPFSFIRVLYTR
jgi:hypothetical protein